VEKEKNEKTKTQEKTNEEVILHDLHRLFINTHLFIYLSYFFQWTCSHAFRILVAFCLAFYINLKIHLFHQSQSG